MTFDELEKEIKKSMMRVAEAGRMEERERILKTLSQAISQYNNLTEFIRKVEDVSVIGGSLGREHRVREILEGYLEAFDKPPMEDIEIQKNSPLKKNPDDFFIYICPECDAQTTVHGFSVKCEGCDFKEDDSPPQEDNWEDAKSKGYDSNNLPACGLCGKLPRTIASAPDMGEVMVDHKCKMPDFNFQGPGHLWFLTEHKEKGEGS